MQVERIAVLEMLRQSHIFLSLDATQLERVADCIEVFLYEENAVIFEQGGPVDGFYILFSGLVKLTRKLKTTEETSILDARDYFGEEALSTREPRRYATASAQGETVVLCIKLELIEQLRKELPTIDIPLRMVLKSYLLAMGISMEWRAPREVVHYIARQHWIFLVLRALPVLGVSAVLCGIFAYLFIVQFPGSSFPLALLVLTLLGMLGVLVWIAVDWSNDFAVVTNRRVVKLERVLLIYDSRQEVPLDAVLAHDLRTDQIGRMLEYGNIVMRTYTGNVQLNRQAHPQLVINLINELRSRKKYRHRHEQLDRIDRTIRERIEHRPAAKNMPNDQEVPIHFKAGVLQEFLSQMFLLRIEEGSNIIYRTHWIILLKKIGWPTLLAIVVAAFTLLTWFTVIPLEAATANLLAVISLPLLGVWWLYQYVDWRNDRYIITPEFVIDVYRKPLGLEERKSAPLRNILSIDYQRKDIIGLIFNFGTVYIKIGETTFTFDNVVNPAEVQREVFQYFVDYKQREENRAEQERHEQMADWIERYHDIIGEIPPGGSDEIEAPDSQA